MLRRIALACLISLGCVSLAIAQLPPLIDRELFFGDPEISGAQISPDGHFISFLKPYNGVRNLWVKAKDAAFDQARPITADTKRPIGNYFWTIDSKYVLYVQDKGGDENFRIYAVDPHATGDSIAPSRDLTPLEKVRATIYDVPRETPDEILVGLNDRRPDLHDVYRLKISTGERTLVWKNEQNVVGWLTDLKGALRLGVRLDKTGGTEILQVKGTSLKKIYSVNAEETCSPVRFTPDGKKFYLVTNKGRDKIELELYDLSSGKATVVDRDPEKEVDFGNALFSDETNELLATFYTGDRTRVYPKQKGFATDWENLKKALPQGELSIGSMTKDENVWIVAVASDVDPGSRYVFDRTTGAATLLYKGRPNLPSEHLAPMTPVRYKARDGMTIPAYLVTPKGLPATNLPTVMLIHGGPWGREGWGYKPEAQFFANRGYAVLIPNFRGSTGYGKKFLNAGNKQWGTGSMQHDISDGVKYLISKGIADPKRVAIYGGSYGGYATLAGLTFTPDLYAAGISYVGPSNIITLLKAIPPYWAPIKKMFALRVGDLENPADVKRLEKQSPLNSAGNIKAPLLVIQGANDPRVNKGESDRIVMAVRDLGRPVEYLVAPDEGHGFAGRENRLAAYTAMEAFLAKHLGGRVQESMSPEVKERLEKLTVDVKSVTASTAAKPATPGTVSVATLDPSRVHADTSMYKSKIATMGQELELEATRTVTPLTGGGKKLWRLIDLSKTPAGMAADTLEIDATTLAPVHRVISQGASRIELAFSKDAIKGTMAMQGMSMPVDVKLSEPAFVAGAGMVVALQTLPLKEGFSTSFNLFDIMTQSTKVTTVAVVGADSVTAGGRPYATYRVEFSTAETGVDQTYWITRDTRRVVKVEAKLPAMAGGGTVSSELVK